MTLEKMANELGVSKSTVSRALSGKGRIGAKTRERIQEFARQQSLENGKEQSRLTATKNLGVVLPGDVYLNGGNYFQECILGVCETAAIMDYNVLITTETVSDTSGIRALVEKKKVDGIILTRSLEDDNAIRYLTEYDFPVGLTGNCDWENVIQVDTDNEAASEELTSLLVGKGYRRFAILIDNMEYMVNKSRYRGFNSALLKNGIAPEQQKIIVGPVKMELLHAVIYDMMAHKVECIICGDDMICTRVMSYLQAEGYRIPRDIAVASLYNNSNLDCFSPSVTAVNVSTRQVGNEICKQMIHFLTGKEYQKRTLVDYEILLRKSTSTVG